jgi:hypothetical protein
VISQFPHSRTSTPRGRTAPSPPAPDGPPRPAPRAAPQIMEQGKYSILLGRFDGFKVASAKPGAGDGTAQISLVDVRASPRPARTPRPPTL